ncbi:MAG: dihydropteroate synthase [Candidatus Delongbacteria bacterium]|nr:dihydropteroate synthase [Candidatus Delongbacteria bacterium]
MVFKAGCKYFDTEKKPLIMGILNVTPDSFSDGGMYEDADSAAERCMQMISEGADIIDIGGESSRPGSKRVSSNDEIERIVPVIKRIREQSDVCISVDTYKADVAEAALTEGADMINNIYGAEPCPDLLRIAASHSAGLCLMHMRGEPGTMQDETGYCDIINEIYSALRDSYEKALLAGISGDSIIIDPGIGFGKSVEGNLSLIRNIGYFKSIGCPVLIGVSRKSFIGKILDNDTEGRLTGTIAANTAAYIFGAEIFRVHDVKENAEALNIARSILKINAEKTGRTF